MMVSHSVGRSLLRLVNILGSGGWEGGSCKNAIFKRNQNSIHKNDVARSIELI